MKHSYLLHLPAFLLLGQAEEHLLCQWVSKERQQSQKSLSKTSLAESLLDLIVITNKDNVPLLLPTAPFSFRPSPLLRSVVDSEKVNVVSSPQTLAVAAAARALVLKSDI